MGAGDAFRAVARALAAAGQAGIQVPLDMDAGVENEKFTNAAEAGALEAATLSEVAITVPVIEPLLTSSVKLSVGLLVFSKESSTFVKVPLTPAVNDCPCCS